MSLKHLRNHCRNSLVLVPQAPETTRELPSRWQCQLVKATVVFAAWKKFRARSCLNFAVPSSLQHCPRWEPIVTWTLDCELALLVGSCRESQCWLCHNASLLYLSICCPQQQFAFCWGICHRWQSAWLRAPTWRCQIKAAGKWLEESKHGTLFWNSSTRLCCGAEVCKRDLRISPTSTRPSSRTSCPLLGKHPNLF